ncbi:hypothetical protein [Aestuariivirga sp.]|uniref:hypothetical protein n=1 Tax=Aestuariivirga sp. TaxID=2650926 RepID=UPI0039E68856
MTALILLIKIAAVVGYVGGFIACWRDFGDQLGDDLLYHPAAHVLVAMLWPLISLYAHAMALRDILLRRVL